VADDVFKQQRDIARAAFQLRDSVGDLGDLKVGGDWRFDPLQLAALFQKRNPLAQIAKMLRNFSRHSFAPLLRNRLTMCIVSRTSRQFLDPPDQ
jgi:hypothetical protein